VHKQAFTRGYQSHAIRQYHLIRRSAAYTAEPLDKHTDITNTVCMYSISDIVGRMPPHVTGFFLQNGDRPRKKTVNTGDTL